MTGQGSYCAWEHAAEGWQRSRRRRCRAQLLGARGHCWRRAQWPGQSTRASPRPRNWRCDQQRSHTEPGAGCITCLIASRQGSRLSSGLADACMGIVCWHSAAPSCKSNTRTASSGLHALLGGDFKLVLSQCTALAARRCTRSTLRQRTRSWRARARPWLLQSASTACPGARWAWTRTPSRCAARLAQRSVPSLLSVHPRLALPICISSHVLSLTSVSGPSTTGLQLCIHMRLPTLPSLLSLLRLALSASLLSAAVRCARWRPGDRRSGALEPGQGRQRGAGRRGGRQPGCQPGQAQRRGAPYP